MKPKRRKMKRVVGMESLETRRVLSGVSGLVSNAAASTTDVTPASNQNDSSDDNGRGSDNDVRHASLLLCLPPVTGNSFKCLKLNAVKHVIQKHTDLGRDGRLGRDRVDGDRIGRDRVGGDRRDRGTNLDVPFEPREDFDLPDIQTGSDQSHAWSDVAEPIGIDPNQIPNLADGSSDNGNSEMRGSDFEPIDETFTEIAENGMPAI